MGSEQAWVPAVLSQTEGSMPAALDLARLNAGIPALRVLTAVTIVQSIATKEVCPEHQDT